MLFTSQRPFRIARDGCAYAMTLRDPRSGHFRFVQPSSIFMSGGSPNWSPRKLPRCPHLLQLARTRRPLSVPIVSGPSSVGVFHLMASLSYGRPRRHVSAGWQGRSRSRPACERIASWLHLPVMCNLYSMTRSREAILRLFRVADNRAGEIIPQPSVFPAYTAPVVRKAGDGKRELVPMSWGFVLLQPGKAPRRVTMPSSVHSPLRSCCR